MSRENITISLKGEIDDLKKKLEDSKKLISDTIESSLSSNKKLKASQEALTQAEKEYQSEIRQTQDAISEIVKIKKTNGKLDSTQKENLVSLNAQLKLYKDKQKRITEDAKEQLKVISQQVSAEKELIAVNKTYISSLNQQKATKQKVLDLEDKSTQSINKTASATTKLANTTIRYLRWAGTIAGVVYAGTRAWDATIGKGIEVNKIIESNTYGIAALVSANTQMIDSLGNTLSPLQKFKLGQEHAKDAIEDIRKASVKTAATFPQLLEIFQQGIGKTLSLGDAFGTTTKEIEKNTITLAARMSNFANAIGMPMDRVREEMRSLVSGNASTDSLISTIIFGSPGAANEAVREASKKVNGLSELFKEKFEPFDILADTQTFEKSILTIQDSWSRAMGDMVAKSGMFKDITNAFYDMAKELSENTDEIVKDFDEIYKVAKIVVGALDEIAIAGAAFYGSKLVISGLYSVAEAMRKVDVATTGATTSMGRLKVVTLSFLKSATPLLAVSAAIAAIAYDTNKMERYVDGMSKKYRDMYEARVKASKTQEEDLALIKEYSNLVGITYDRINSPASTDSQKEIYQAQTKELERQLEILGSRVHLTSKQRELADNQTKTLEKVGELQANLAYDAELYKDTIEKVEKSKGNIAKLDKEKLKIEQELATTRKHIASQEVLLSKASVENQKALEVSIQQLRKREQVWLDGISATQKEIDSEKEKIATKTESISKQEYKSAVELNREFASQQAIKAEIAMFEKGILDDEQIKISLQEIKLQGLVTEYDLLNKKEDKEKVLLDIYREGANYQKLVTSELEKQEKAAAKERSFGNIKTYIDTSKFDMGALNQLEEGLRLTYVDDEESLNDLDKFIEKAKKKLYKEDLTVNIKFEGFDDISSSMATIANSYQNMQKEAAEYNRILTDKDSDPIQKKQAQIDYADATISGYSNMIGAVASFYDEDDSRRKKQLELQKVMNATKMAMQFAEMAQSTAFTSLFVAQKAVEATAAGTVAVATAAASSPWTGFATAAAMAAMLASFGIMLGGNESATTTSDYYSSLESNTGIGTVLGDTEAQSESIVKALSILEDFASPQYATLQSMNNYLETIATNIGGVTSLLVQSGGFAFGEGYEGYDTGYKNNISVSSGLMSLGGTAYALGTLNPISLAVGAIDKLLLGGAIGDMFTGAVNSVLGGLFGKTKVYQDLTDSGIFFADTLLSSAIDQFNGQAFQEISTTVTKKSWFSKSSSTVVDTYFESLDAETNRQFSLVLSNLYDTTLIAGDALDVSSESLQNSLNSFIVSIGKVSLKDKTGQEIQETLTAIFGKIGDDLSKAAFPLLTPFQQIGEGLFETMTRVATGMEEAEYYISRLGIAFSDISYTDIINQQGDVGFETLLQSIIKTDEATNGLNNNLVQIIGNLNSTAEELYIAYNALDGLRDRIKFLGQDANSLSSAMIYGAGSLESLNSGFEAYFENFLTESEQIKYQVSDMRKEFEKLGISMPSSKDSFSELINGLDLSSSGGQELYGRLITLSESFADMSDEVESFYESSLSGIMGLSKAFTTMGDSIQDTIDSLLSTVDDSNEDVLVSRYWQKKREIDSLLALDGDLTSSQQSELESLISNINSLSTSIQSSTIGDKSAITGSLVQDLSFLQEQLNFDNQILNVNIVGIKTSLGIIATNNQEYGMITSLPSFDVGTSNVSRDMIAQIHKNEIITPATMSEGIRNGELTLGNNKDIISAIMKLEKRLEKIETNTNKTAKVLEEAQYEQAPIAVKVIA
jgi:hypothetical protein